MMEEHAAAVVEPTHPTLKVLHVLVQVKQEEYDQLSETYAELWAQRKAATLDDMGYVRYLKTKDRMELLLRELEALKPQVTYGEAHEALTIGAEHYDANTEAVTADTTQICHALAQLVQACGQFVQRQDERIRLLWSLPDASGSPAFDLPDGLTLLQRMLGAVPGQQAGLVAMVINLLRTPFTAGDAQRLVEQVPGLFPETLVRRFLAGYQVEKSQPEEAC